MRIALFFASARYPAASAIRGGHQVVAVDYFGDWDVLPPGHSFSQSKIFSNSERLYRELDNESLDGVILGGGFENRPDVSNRLCQRLDLIGHAPIFSTQEYLQRWRLLGGDLREFGGNVPETRLAVEAGGRAGLLKNLMAAGGRHVREVGCVEMIGAIGIDTVFQERVDGRSLSAIFVRLPDRTCRLIGLTYQLVGRPELGASGFQYCGSIGPLHTEPKQVINWERLGEAIADRFEISGVFGVDFIVEVQASITTRWVVDINSRIPASAELLEWQSRDWSAVGLHVAASRNDSADGLNEEWIVPTVARQSIGKAIVFCREGSEIQIDDARFAWLRSQVKSLLEPHDRRRWIADVPKPGTRIDPGQPIVSCFYRGSHLVEIEQGLYGYAEEIFARLATSDEWGTKTMGDAK